MPQANGAESITLSLKWPMLSQSRPHYLHPCWVRALWYIIRPNDSSECLVLQNSSYMFVAFITVPHTSSVSKLKVRNVVPEMHLA